jgi:hypothetical protein
VAFFLKARCGGLEQVRRYSLTAGPATLLKRNGPALTGRRDDGLSWSLIRPVWKSPNKFIYSSRQCRSKSASRGGSSSRRSGWLLESGWLSQPDLTDKPSVTDRKPFACYRAIRVRPPAHGLLCRATPHSGRDLLVLLTGFPRMTPGPARTLHARTTPCSPTEQRRCLQRKTPAPPSQAGPGCVEDAGVVCRILKGSFSQSTQRSTSP